MLLDNNLWQVSQFKINEVRANCSNLRCNRSHISLIERPGQVHFFGPSRAVIIDG